MPYIENKADRWDLDFLVEEFLEILNKKGNLNYFLCRLFTSQELNYDLIRKFFGEIESAKLEIYRRWVAPYEDRKKEENGDVYGGKVQKEIDIESEEPQNDD